METRKGSGFFRIVGKIVGGIVVAALFAVAVGALVMVLWNWLMPELFGLGTITYGQGFGLVLLMRLLIGGFSDHGRGPAERPRQYRRDQTQTSQREHFDEVYEAWWQHEGAARFEAYMKQKKEEPEAENDQQG